MLRRYVPGPGLDEPLVWYEGAGVSDRRFLAADERGSVIATMNNAGAATAINAYDEFGIPASSNSGRFGFAGAVWLPEALLYHMRARAYAPSVGRFQQADPVLRLRCATNARLSCLVKVILAPEALPVAGG